MGSGHYPLLPLVGLAQMQRQGAAEPCPRQGMDWPGKTLQGHSISERGCASKVGEAFAPELGDWETQGGSQGWGGGGGEWRRVGGQGPLDAHSTGLPPTPL